MGDHGLASDIPESVRQSTEASTGTAILSTCSGAVEKPDSGLPPRLETLATFLCGVLALVGALGLFGAPLFATPTFFDENALLPGGADADVTNGGPDKYRTGEFKERAKDRLQRPDAGYWLEWLAGEMDAAGLEGKVTYTLQDTTAPATSRSCGVASAVFRPARADGKEAVVIVTPIWAGTASGAEAGSVAIASVHRLLAHLHSCQWLSKNIVWLAPDGRCGASGQTAVSNWLASYHRSPQGAASFPAPAGMHRAGRLQEALVLELPAEYHGSYDSFVVNMQGAWGKLPNMDLVHLVTWVIKRFTGRRADLALSPFVKRSVEDMNSWFRRLGFGPLSLAHRGYLEQVLGLAGFAGLQFSGQDLGAHGPFLSYGADALTVRAVVTDGKPTAGIKSVLELSQVLLVSLRSLSNLLEQFHHSTDMYALLDSGTFVSAEMYFVPLGALLAALCIKANKIAQEVHDGTASSWFRAVKTCLMARMIMHVGAEYWFDGPLSQAVRKLCVAFAQSYPQLGLLDNRHTSLLFLCSTIYVTSLLIHAPALTSWRQLKTVVLLLLAVEGAAVGCANWVVAYGLVLSLSPAVLFASPWRRNNEKSSRVSLLSFNWGAFLSAMLSPIVMTSILSCSAVAFTAATDGRSGTESLEGGTRLRPPGFDPSDVSRTLFVAMPDTVKLCMAVYLPSWLCVVLIGLSTP